MRSFGNGDLCGRIDSVDPTIYPAQRQGGKLFSDESKGYGNSFHLSIFSAIDLTSHTNENGTMLGNLLIGLSMMLVCLFLQSILIVAAFRYYSLHKHLYHGKDFLQGLALAAGVMLLLVFGNLAQIGAWAVAFMLLGEFQLFSDAFYHSAVNFATLGYGDLVMSPKRKLLGPLEAVNGALMVGLSTAALITVLQDIMRTKNDGNV